MTHGAPDLLVVAVVVAGAALLKGAVGFGFPLVAVPLLSARLGPHVAVPVLAVPTLVSNFILVCRGRSGGGSARPFVVLLAALIVGTVGGAFLINVLRPRVLDAVVGAVAVLYVCATAFHLTVRIPQAAGRRAAPVVGLLAGAMGGATGIYSPLLASYLHLVRAGKREFVFWITVMFFVGNIAQVGSYIHLGFYGGPVLGTALLACIPMGVGTWLGLVLQDRLRPQVFGRVVLVIVFLASLNLLVRGLLRQ